MRREKRKCCNSGGVERGEEGVWKMGGGRRERG